MSKNQYLVKYEERKSKIISLLQETGDYLRDNGKEDDAESMFKLKEDVEKNLFSVVLIGEFSVGKSTFLNALMRRRMLPSFKKETTATVNFLRHTSQAPNGEAGIVYYRDGEIKTLPDLNLETIAKYVSTTGDVGKKTIAKTVEKVDLFLNSKFLEDGVMLVDSPGLNGITENLESITRRQIKESHACIFMFSTDHPGTRTEFEILRDLRTECNSIFIVLNKIEEIKASEGESVKGIVKHLKDNYMKQFPDATLPEIYPISAYTALAARDRSVPIERDSGRVKNEDYYAELEEKSRLGDFEDRLLRYLTEGERTREQLSEPVKKVVNALQNEREDLDTQIKALEESRSTSELEAQKVELEDAIAKLQNERQETTKPLRERFNKALRDFKDKISAHCATIISSTKTRAENCEDIDDLQVFAEGLPESLKKQFVNLSQRLEDDLRDDLKFVVDESVEYLDGLQEALSQVGGGELKLYNRELKLTTSEVGRDMEAMERSFAEKRRQMEELELEMSSAEADRSKARKLERQRDDLQRQLKEIAERRNAVLDTFDPPRIEYINEEKIEKKTPGGILGIAKFILFGRDKVKKINRVVDEGSKQAHDDAIEARDKRVKELDTERENLLQEMNRYANQNVGSSEEFDAEIQRKSRRLEQLQEAYKSDVAKYMEKLDKDAAKARRKIRREIDDYAESFVAENVQGINKHLASIESKMFEAVKALIEARVNDEIERQQKKLDMLIEDSKASIAERDEKLQRANAARDLIVKLLGQVAEVENELADMNDTIEDET